jgi:hypothetical protein
MENPSIDLTAVPGKNVTLVVTKVTREYLLPP